MAFLNRLFQRKKEKETTFFKEEEALEKELHLERRMSYQIANLQGIGAREQQEDSFAFVNAMDVTEIRKSGLFAIVADGMGGMANGKQASEMAIACLKEAFADVNYKGDICLQLKACMRHAGDKIYAKFGRKSGTTAIACLFYEEKLYFASIGDSSLYLKRGNKLILLNREQSYKEHLLRKMVHQPQWNLAMAWNDPEAECLMEFLGKDDMSAPDGFVKPFPLQAGDQVLLCSDGISKVLSDEEFLQCLDTESAVEACERVERMIMDIRLPGQDNYTMILVSCGF